jgi:hypothetical protein
MVSPTWSFATVGASALTVLLGLSAVYALLVVLPRLTHSGEGIVFFGAVSKYQSSDAYADEIAKRSASDLTEARVKHSFDVAKVCTRKYDMLRRSMWLLAVGLIAALPLLASV